MKRLRFSISAFALLLLIGCNAPETAAEVNEDDEATEQLDEGVNKVKEDNTDVQTMEEKYKGSDEDLILDSL